jgi:two-component system sensor histidine kinase KdpD
MTVDNPLRRPAGNVVGWVSWFALLALVTAALLWLRGSLDRAHVALAYLLLVQGASARHGRPLGLTLAAVAFLSFDVLFIPPYGTLAVAKQVDWIVLMAFLVTSLVAAQLLASVRREATTATLRAAEMDRLSTLGAETLNAGRAEEALGAVAEVIRATLGLDACAIYLHDDDGEVIRLARHAPEGAPERFRGGVDEIVKGVFRTGAPVALRSSGIIDVLRPGEGGELVPDELPPGVTDVVMRLDVRGRGVGALEITRNAGILLQPGQRRFLGALAYYAALGAERVRLVGRAEHADALREAARVKDAVLASVSHDLRTPLTTIKAMAHDLAAGGDERAHAIEEEADRLGAFVADLLDMSRLGSGSPSLAIEPNEAEDLIGAVLRRVAGTTQGREIRASFGEGEAFLFGRFDFSETLRAMVNLVENALKYSPAATPIDLSARREGTWLTFSVSDRGPGVPEAERDRIFEPFYRPPGVPPDVRGAGLGLSIARAVAQAQGGSLDYAPREGGGSTFVLRVPSIDVEQRSVQQEASDPRRRPESS